MRGLIAAAVMAGILGFGATAQAKTLTFCTDAAPEGYDPALYVTTPTMDGSARTLYDRLVAHLPGSDALVPGLAQSWEVGKDGLEYIFHLRPDVAFHTTFYFTPSRPLNADDVVFSLDRQLDPKDPYHDYAGANWPYFNALGLDRLIKSVDKIDSQTVRIRLTRPDAGFLADMAMDFASILSDEYADQLRKAKTPGDLNTRPIGTGPFRFGSDAYPDRVLYWANDAYWGGRPKIDGLTFKVVPRAADRLSYLQVGDCDVMGAPDVASVKAASSDPKLKVATAERLDVSYLAFNTTKPPFNDARVRLALSHAVDRKAIVAKVYQGLAEPGTTIMPKGMWSFDPGVFGGFHSVDRAKQLLADAGVSNLKLDIIAMNTPRPYDPDPAETARMIAADFAKVGVEATVSTPEPLGSFLRQSIAKDRDAAVLFGWDGGNGDPDDFLTMLLSCKAVGASNRAEWCDKGFTELLDKARAESDPIARAALYGEAQRQLADAQPLLPLVHSLVAVPMANTVTGYVVDPFGHHDFANVDLVEPASN